MLITSCSRKHPIIADHTINCEQLPNPYTIPSFRPSDGRDKRIKQWLLQSEQVTQLINQETAYIKQAKPQTVAVTCKAGRHRSVAIAELIADQLAGEGIPTKVEHRNLKPKKNRDAYAWAHQQQRRRLKAKLVEGTPCWWCGRPMSRDQLLHADHTNPVKHGGQLADRLLHGLCNEQRGAGDNDQRRPALGRPDCLPILPIKLNTGGYDPRFPVKQAKPATKTTQTTPGTWFKWK